MTEENIPLDSPPISMKKRTYALELLKQGDLYTQVHSKVKEKFGEEISLQDLKLIKSAIFELPTDINLYIQAFKDTFTTLTNDHVKNSHPIVRKTLRLYADLMIGLEKQHLLNDTLPEFRENELILIGLKSFEGDKKRWLS